ncbi:MAG: hypothetical protein R6V84_11945, partial [Desulfobacterales bacterium]
SAQDEARLPQNTLYAAESAIFPRVLIAANIFFNNTGGAFVILTARIGYVSHLLELCSGAERDGRAQQRAEVRRGAADQCVGCRRFERLLPCAGPLPAVSGDQNPRKNGGLSGVEGVLGQAGLVLR